MAMPYVLAPLQVCETQFLKEQHSRGAAGVGVHAVVACRSCMTAAVSQLEV